MDIEVREERSSILTRYAELPMVYEVDRTLAINETGMGGITLTEQKIDPPYNKDYDAHPDEGPLTWADKWDLSNWGILVAYSGDDMLGGAVLAWDTPGVFMLEGRRDLAVLWDIRVHPKYQRMGVGKRLFESSTTWARARDCKLLKIETQNVNVPACRFYQNEGCTLGAINRFAYPDLPGEICLMWYKELEPQA